MAFAKHILLTGWTGFVGRRVFALLGDRAGRRDTVYCLGRSAFQPPVRLPGGATARFLRADLADAGQVAAAVSALPRVTHAVHLAAVSTQDADPVETVRVNVRGTLGLAACLGPYTHFLFASSAAVFGDRLADAPREDDPHAPTTVYGETKSLAELYLRHRCRRLCVVRPVAQVGAGATHGLLRDVIAKLKSDSPCLELRGDEPGSAKPFLHADDTAAALVELCLGGVEGTFHLSPGADDCMTVARVARVAMEVLGLAKPIRWLGTQSLYRGDQRVVRLTPSGRARLRFCPSEEAVRRAVAES